MPRPPKQWHNFSGQQGVISRLKALIAGAKKLGVSCPNLLFVGAPGMGKTELSRTAAADHGAELYYHQAGPETDPEKLFSLLSQLKHGSFLLLDEIHALRTPVQEYLYLPLEERKVVTVGKEAGTLVSLPEFTLIGATTWPSKLAAPFRSRLLRIEFEPYRYEELRVIAQRCAREKGSEITGQAASLIAETAAGSRSSQAGTPRGVRKLVDEVILNHPGQENLGLDEVQAVFTRIGIRDGLWPIHREYMLTLQGLGGTCSLERLAIGKDRKSLMEDVEPLLVLRGLIEITDRGRLLTAKGIQAIREFPGRSDGSACVTSNEDI